MGIKWLLFINIVLLGLFVGVPFFEEVIHHIIEKHKEIGKGKMIASIVLIIIAVIFTAIAFIILKQQNITTEVEKKLYSINEGENIFVLPESSNKVSFENFKDNDSIKSVHFYNPKTEIDSATFMGCKKLELIEFPSNLEEIKPLTFAYCKALRIVDIPESVTNIGTIVNA